MSALGVSLHKQMLDPGSIIEVIKVTSDKLDDAASRVPDAPAGRIPDVTGIDADTAEFLTKAAGGPLGEIWAMLGAEFRLRRWKRGVRLAERAAEHLREVGREAERVRDDTLVPLLEAGSLVDEENMQVRWGALLANAADPGADEVPPSFPEMLRQLSSIEARLLDEMTITRSGGQMTHASGVSRDCSRWNPGCRHHRS